MQTRTILQQWIMALCLVLPLMVACEQVEITPPVRKPTDSDTSGRDKPIPIDTAVKKGAGISTTSSEGVWWKNVINLKPHWYYTWGLSVPDGMLSDTLSQAEFVPMFWNGAAVTESNIQKVNELYRTGKIKYVLGFNEPDLARQANMSVALALEKWQVLCEGLDPGIKLVSPVTSYPTLVPKKEDEKWLISFMDSVVARGLRVDYVAVHIYQPPTASNFTTPIQAVYERWGKKVWITEVAVRDDDAAESKIVSQNRYTPLQVLSLMQALLPEFERMEAVYRYAWFNASTTMSGSWPSGLIDANGLLTLPGQYYSSLHPNTAIGTK